MPGNSSDMQPTPESILQSTFGYTTFRPLQREIIANVLAKRDTLAIMPTGGGKSLCYQLPSLIFPGLTVVVSPLIALMKDQVEQLQALGIPALFLNSSLSPEEYRDNMQRVRSGQVKLLYVAPETLLTTRIFDLLAGLASGSGQPLDCLTIDEAHCISEWGHDFRPEYRQLAAVRRRFPQAICLALTATATPRVRSDIQSSLGFETGSEFVASFNRPNLSIEVIPKTDPERQTLAFLQRFPRQSGIIYCFSRRQVDELTEFLGRRGYAARPYHAGLPDEDRRANQEAFIRDDAQVIVATIAFGMGINKPNVRFVIHYDLPKSVEGYYQEIGRAGRDGLPAHCLLLYSYSDVHKLRYFIDQKEEQEKQNALQHLESITRYAESDVCRRVTLLNYFGEAFTTHNCGACDNCLAGQKELVDITIPAQKFLSCAARTGEHFGAGHLTDVLLGSNTEKIRRLNHQALSTYGIGQELDRKGWLHLSRQLLQQGLLEQNEHGSLLLTAEGREALRTRRPIQGVLRAEARPAAPAKLAGSQEYDPALFELLRKKRKEMADQAGVPPYVIFSDKTLVEMAAYYPSSPAALLKINGVGQHKLAIYGTAFLGVIQAYCQANGLSEKLSVAASAAPPPGQMALNARYLQVGEAYQQGESIAALMEHYGVKQDTIVEHLVQYRLQDHPLRYGSDIQAICSLPEALQIEALAAFAEYGPGRLKPIFDRLGGRVNWADLKLLRLRFLVESQDQ